MTGYGVQTVTGVNHIQCHSFYSPMVPSECLRISPCALGVCESPHHNALHPSEICRIARRTVPQRGVCLCPPRRVRNEGLSTLLSIVGKCPQPLM